MQPASPRDAARLLVVRPASPSPRLRGEGTRLEDRLVRDLPDLLRPGDALVFNDTRVIRAALEGERVRGETRARISFNLHKRVDDSRWRAFARPAKRLAVGDRIRFGHDGRVCFLGTLDATVTEIGEAGEVELSFSMHSAYLDQAIEALGDPPLPPYIAGKRDRASPRTPSATRRSMRAARVPWPRRPRGCISPIACSRPWTRAAFPAIS